MVERQDIDALMIGALYGELTPAEEARLTAHLESHPTDRTALDDLRGTREKLQQSRILTFQYEPPQSISALLIQEASRRAPKRPAEGEGWFARFVRSFIQHPAMAAAAMIVVVVGASALVSRTGNKFAETPAVETSKATDNRVVAMETPAAAPADQYKVDLANGELEDANAESKKTEGASQQALPETDPSVAFYTSGSKGDALGAAKPKPKTDTGLELRRRDAMPKDFDEAKVVARREPTPIESKPRALEESATKAPTTRQSAESAGPSSRGAREQAGYVADGRVAGGGAAPKTGTTASPTATAPRTATPPAPPPPPPATVAPQQVATDTTTADAKANEKSAEKATNDPNLAWAKDQHAALVTAVRANNCGRAANIALSIANRTPAYYAQNVETDRSVKQCIAYINDVREKDAELRASRAKKSQLKAAEPSAPKRAADQPDSSSR